MSLVKIPSYSLDHYNKHVIKRIMDKYGLDQMEASKAFLTSETHRMLEDSEMAMWEFSEGAIFDIWEVERRTGDPRNSAYLKGE